MLGDIIAQTCEDASSIISVPRRFTNFSKIRKGKPLNTQNCKECVSYLESNAEIASRVLRVCALGIYRSNPSQEAKTPKTIEIHKLHRYEILMA